MTENRVAYGRMAYNADNVLYLIERGYMAALWTSDPELYALGPQAMFDRLADTSVEVEMIGDATLFCKNQGSPFSGWIAKSGPHHSDAIRYKSEALELLGSMVAEQFTARGDIAPPRVYDYGTTITASMRHNVADGAGDKSLCDRTMRHVIKSEKYDPWSMVAGLPTCRPCASKAKAGGMVTRRRAAQIIADAAAERLDAAHAEAEQVLAEVAPVIAEAELAAAEQPAAGTVLAFTKAAEAELAAAEQPAAVAPASPVEVVLAAFERLEGAPRPAEAGDKLVHPRPTPVEACPSPVDASPAPALPQVDDSAPLGRRDLVTYKGSRYVIIRADSSAALARAEGHVEVYPGSALPERIRTGERGHWVEASACSRRLVLEWGVRYRDPVTDKAHVIAHPGRAFAEHGVELAVALGERSAELVARAPAKEWAPAPMRTAAERAAEAEHYRAMFD